jgi:hypothetical protein
MKGAFPSVFVANNNLPFTPSVVRLSLAKTHIFCNSYGVHLLAAKCQAVFPSLFVANNNLFLSPLLLNCL